MPYCEQSYIDLWTFAYEPFMNFKIGELFYEKLNFLYRGMFRANHLLINSQILSHSDLIRQVLTLIGLLPETQFNIDLIVQTIRSSYSTPQTQQQAMMLLSVAASIYPVSVPRLLLL